MKSSVQKEELKNEKAALVLPNLFFVVWEDWISFTVILDYGFFQEQVLHKISDSMNEISYFHGKE